MRSKTPRPAARITEIFSSIQGEGPRTGERHIFIRFEACHLTCAYCDEASKKGRAMTLPEVLRKVEILEKTRGPHACVSLTGGEPLLEAAFLKKLCRALKKKRFRILLETNGVLWGSLSKVLPLCDIISMDLKLPSVTRQPDFLEEHREFLKRAKEKELYLKIVISKGVNLPEYRRHLRMVASVAPQTPVFLQPVSRSGKKYPEPGLMNFLNKLQRTGAKVLPGIRAGIQLHKVLNIR